MYVIRFLVIFLVAGIGQGCAETTNEHKAMEKVKCLAQKGNIWDADGRVGQCITVEMQKECTARGGEWQPVGMARILYCFTKYQDGGKLCTDSFNCKGSKCLDVGNKPNKEGIIYGECVSSDYQRGDCIFRIEKGKKAGGVCRFRD